MGAWEPTPEFFERLIAPDTRDADVSRPYPFYLAYPLERAARRAGRPGRLDGRMEVGRHPRAAHPPGRPHLPLVARRGAADRPVSRGRGGRRAAAGRHGARRRDAALGRRRAAAVRPAAAPDRPQDARPRRSWPRCRWCWSPTICSRRAARTSAACRSRERRARLGALLEPRRRRRAAAAVAGGAGRRLGRRSQRRAAQARASAAPRG